MENTKLTITKDNFLTWFFNTGSDDEQKDTKIDLANSMIGELFSQGKTTIDVHDIFNRCNFEIIPMKFINENENHDVDLEVGEVFEYFDLRLV